MNRTKLKRILENHSKWLRGKGGEKAVLQGANLRDADLRSAVLRDADLQYVDLQYVDLQYADLRGADLRGADLRGVDLRGVDLRGADLRGADLRGVDLDFSSGIPFHCGGTGAIIDQRLFVQMVYHLTRQDTSNLDLESQSWLHTIPERILNGFCNYRDDVNPK